MGCYLYGIIETNEAKNFGPVGFDILGEGKGEVKSTGFPLAAVVGPSPFESVENLDKEALMKTLMTHQETLEAIMKKEFILPCKFGSVLKNEKEAEEIISQNEEQIRGWLSKMKNTFELDLVVTWDPKPILMEIAQKDPEIIQRTQTLKTLSLECQEREKVALGASLSAKLKMKASQHAKEILKRLHTVSEVSSLHDVMNDEMVCNISFLISSDQEAPFYKALDDLDLQMDGKLHFRCVGPLPPYSFATVVLKRFEKREVLWAQKVLGIYGTVNSELVKKAYKKLVGQCHPDTHPEVSPKEFETIHQAHEFLMEYCEGGLRPVTLSIGGA